MFGSVPGLELTGEHWGILKEAAAILGNLKTAELQNGISWKNHGLDEHRVACSVQHLVKNVVLGKEFDALSRNSTVFGFKEIRYTNPEMLRFLWNVFPCARFVFTYREDSGAKVRAHGFQEKNLQMDWELKRKVVLAVHKAFPNTTGLLGVDHLSVDDYNKILSGQLGIQGCHFNHIVHENADGGYTRNVSAHSDLLEGICDLSAVNFRLEPQQIEANKGIMWRLYNDIKEIFSKASEVPAVQNSPQVQKPPKQEKKWQQPKPWQGGLASKPK